MAKVEEYYEVVGEGWSDSKVGDDFVGFGGDYEVKDIALDMGGEVTCWIRLKEVSRLLRDRIEGGLGKLKSPNIMVLGDIVCRKRRNSSRNGSMEREGGR